MSVSVDLFLFLYFQDDLEYRDVHPMSVSVDLSLFLYFQNDLEYRYVLVF
jgi:hypothetical protein